MDIWTHLQFLTIPKGLRNFIVGLTMTLFFICIYMFVIALYGNDKPDWIEAAAYLTSIVFPITLVIILVSSLQSGMQSIQIRVTGFLTKSLPDILRNIPQPKITFHPMPLDGHEFKSDAPDRLANIEVAHITDSCIVGYRITFQRDDGTDVCLYLQVEFNVRRVNLVIYFDAEVVESLSGKNGGSREEDEEVVEYIISRLKHTLYAAEMNVVTKKNRRGSEYDPDDMTYDEGYQFNRTLSRATIVGKPFYYVVGVRKVSDDMLWHAAEKIYFSQDLLIMMRAMISECPELFRAGKAA